MNEEVDEVSLSSHDKEVGYYVIPNNDNNDNNNNNNSPPNKNTTTAPNITQTNNSSKTKNIKDIIDYSERNNNSNAKLAASHSKIIQGLKKIYKTKLLSIEQKYSLHALKLLPTDGIICDAEFDARPMVLLLGQYSTGKTTFLRHLVGGDFPGMHIGPEPTTDRFIALVHGEDEGEEKKASTTNKKNDDDSSSPSSSSSEQIGGKIIKGNSLTVTPELPFASLSQFGSSFLNHFEGSISSSKLLKHVTLIDTPGVLSGETTQRLSRDYDFATTAKWFADRSDMILLLFDAHKVDVSDEMKRVIERIRPHNDDKIRCVLNKADGVSAEELVRVYGSLMWSMGRTFRTPEVVRVFAGSFWGEPYKTKDFQQMFEKDERRLVEELLSLPKSAAERKVNRMVKRIRLVKAQCCLLGHLRQKLSWWWWNPATMIMSDRKNKIREKLLVEMDTIMDEVCTKYQLARGDMPSATEFSSRLAASFPDFSVFPVPSKKLLRTLDNLIAKDIPNLMKGAGGVTGVTISATSANATTDVLSRNERQKGEQSQKVDNKQHLGGDKDRSLEPLEAKGNGKIHRARKSMKIFMFIFSMLFMVFVGWVFLSENKWISKVNYGGYAWLCSLISSWVWGG